MIPVSRLAAHRRLTLALAAGLLILVIGGIGVIQLLPRFARPTSGVPRLAFAVFGPSADLVYTAPATKPDERTTVVEVKHAEGWGINPGPMVGALLAYTVRPPGGPTDRDAPAELWLLDVATHEQTRLARDADLLVPPRLLPGGKALLYRRTEGDQQSILSIDIATQARTTLYAERTAFGLFPIGLDAGGNLGFSKASNLGIRASQGRALLLLNSDTIVPAGAIDRLVQVLAAHPEATVIGPRLVDADRRPELSFGSMISPLVEWRQGRLVRALAAGDPAVSQRVGALVRRAHWPDWVSGACLLVRREAAEAVGLLDERFFMYTEDVDFCASIRARGGRVLFTPEVEIIHLGGRSKATAPAATHALYRRSHLAFYEKHHPRLAPLLRLYTRLRDR